MRRVIASAFVSLDGVMQAPGGPDEDPTGSFAFGGWVYPYWNGQLEEAIGEVFDRPFDLLLGRRTYEIFAAYWPYVEDPMADIFNAATKYVATKSNPRLDWAKSVAVSGDVPAEVARLKSGDGPDLLIQGSSVLIQSLLAEALIDDLTVITFPVLLGRGKKLFGETAKPEALRLEAVKHSSTGVVTARYFRDGEIRTGSFAATAPSEAEIARRKRWAQEG